MVKINLKIKDSFLFVTCILFMLLIFSRDVWGIAVNKYIFVAITFMVLGVLDTRKTLEFFWFLVPLFNGLPGNYICLLILLKLVFKLKNKALGACSMLYAALIFSFEVMHISELSNILNYFFWGIKLTLFIIISIQEKNDLDFKNIILAFSSSFVFCGIVMLICVNDMGYLQQVMEGRYRFGDFSEISLDYVRTMRLSIDPNFLGLFALSAIMGLYMILQKTVKNKLIYIFLLIASAVLGFLTLSRTFFVLLIVFVLMSTLLQKTNIKQKITSVVILGLATVVVIFIVNRAFPKLFESIFGRLANDDYETAGGRSILNSEYIDLFFENVKYFLFGTGCIEMLSKTKLSNNLHCTWLQLPIGFGIIGFSLIIFVGFALKRPTKFSAVNKERKSGLATIFLMIQIIYYAFLPAMENTSQLFPLLLGVLIFNNYYDYGEKKNYGRA